MSPADQVEIAAATFVGTHFVLSHPLRRPLVRALGEKGFLGLYSLVALATFGWMIWAARHAGPETPRWDLGQGGLVIGSLLMWLGSILFVGSFKGNPSLPDPGRRPSVPSSARGVFRITRHPMMWAFGLWAVTHVIVNPRPTPLILAEAIFVLAIFGAAAQDQKKIRLVGSTWREWMRKSPFFPFGRGLAWPGAGPVIVGTVLFLAATWAHGALGYRLAGPWAFLG